MSVYDDHDVLVAVLDCIEDHSFQNKYGERAVWIGLLQVDMSKQKMGLGRTITEALIDACRMNGKEWRV